LSFSSSYISKGEHCKINKISFTDLSLIVYPQLSS
jgi:hypothetical protein